MLPKPGQRIECLHMQADPRPIAPGMRGTVLRAYPILANAHQIEVAWDNGRKLALLECDSWKLVTAEQVQL